MARAIALRSDFTGAQVRALARQSKHASQARLLLALAVIYDGGSRSEAARLGDVTLQIVRDWALRFNTEGPRGLIDRKPPSQPRLLTAEHRQGLMTIIESGPILAIHGVVRWRICDLGQWLWEEVQLSVSKQTLGRELRAVSLRKLWARPKHLAKAPQAIETFQKTSPARWQASRPTRASASMQ